MNRLLLILLSLFICNFSWHLGATQSSPNVKRSEILYNTLAYPEKRIEQFVLFNPEFLNLYAKDSIAKCKHKKKKSIAAILAFPLPFGMLGLHRIFLGTKPYIPFVYIGTVGGSLGILPLLDFIAILNSDEKTFRQFENNPKVFMWGR